MSDWDRGSEQSERNITQDNTADWMAPKKKRQFENDGKRDLQDIIPSFK